VQTAFPVWHAFPSKKTEVIVLAAPPVSLMEMMGAVKVLKLKESIDICSDSCPPPDPVRPPERLLT